MNKALPPTALEPPKPVSPHKEVRTSPLPEPPRTRSRWRWIWLLVLIGLGVAAYLFWPKISAYFNAPATSAKGGRGGRGGAGGPTQVVGAKATRGNINLYYTGLGAVTPIYTVTIKTRVDGQLMAVHFKEGDVVKEGDTLLEIDPRPYEVQLTQAEGQLIKDEANLANARVDLSRYQTLLAQNAVPEQQLATQKATVSQDEGAVKIDQGQIAAAKLNITYCHITAPISGLIGLRLVDPGNIVHASDANGLLVIAQVAPISVIFTIAEDQLPVVLQKLRGGQHLQVDAFDREMTTKLASGTLTTSDNLIDQSTGTLKFRATFDNSRNQLFPNQFVNARLLVEPKHGVIVLPTAAIQRNSQTGQNATPVAQTYAWLVKPDSTVTVRQIEVGTAEGDQTEITSGLQEGDVVVMTGVDKLTEGGKVNVHLQGENPQGGQGGRGGRKGGGANGGSQAGANVPQTKPQGAPGNNTGVGGHGKGKGNRQQ